jgi:hypothetical protein
MVASCSFLYEVPQLLCVQVESCDLELSMQIDHLAMRLVGQLAQFIFYVPQLTPSNPALHMAMANGTSSTQRWT